MQHKTIDKICTEKNLGIIVNYSNHVENHKNCFKLLLICDGESDVKINDDTINVTSPSLICLDERKQIKILSPNKLAIKTIYFDPAFINRNITINTIRSSVYPYLTEQHSYFQLIPFLEHNDIYKSILLLNDYMFNLIHDNLRLCKNQLEEQNDYYWSCRTRSYFMEIIQNIERMYHNYSNIFSNVKLKDKEDLVNLDLILSFINANINTPINLKQICIMFNTNRTKLEIIFNKHLGITFYDYISLQRTERASNMLRFTNLSLSEISLKTGYSSTQNFCKFFKRKMNISPEKFRREETYKRIATNIK